MIAENVYFLPITDTLHLAWEKAKGTKKTIWAAFLVVSIFILIFAITQAVLVTLYPKTPHLKSSLQLIFQILNYLFQMGILSIGINRAFDLPIHYGMVFNGFKQIIKLLALYILEIGILALLALPVILFVMMLNYLTTDISKDFLIGILFFVLALASIYVAMRMYLAPGFILDKKINPWKALMMSFQAARFNFWRLISINIIGLVIVAISVIPLGIGLIWTIPFMVVCYGIVYQRLSVNASAQPVIVQAPSL